MWETILAAMLFLQPPGKSIYSQVVVPETAPAPCDNDYSLLCLPPRYSKAHKAFTVAENWEQGLARYAVIARAAHEVVYEQKRQSPPGQLLRFLLAFTYHESGYRRDVHEGIGDASRGDCKWRTVKLPGGKTRRERIPGSCQSHCLAQIMVGPKRSKKSRIQGFHADELVGLSYDNTKNCLSVAANIIDRAYRWCARRGPRPLSYCVVTHYAGGMVPNTDRRVVARVKTVNKLASAPTKLEKRVRQALKLDGKKSKADEGKLADAN
jgi:hypothetical protein